MPQLAKKNAWCSFVLKQNVLSGIFPEIRGMGNADYKQPGNRHELAFSRSHPRFGEWVVCLSLHACYMNACIRILACLCLFEHAHIQAHNISHAHIACRTHVHRTGGTWQRISILGFSASSAAWLAASAVKKEAQTSAVVTFCVNDPIFIMCVRERDSMYEDEWCV